MDGFATPVMRIVAMGESISHHQEERREYEDLALRLCGWKRQEAKPLISLVDDV